MKGEAHPFAATEQNKFNPLQQLAYLAIMYALGTTVNHHRFVLCSIRRLRVRVGDAGAAYGAAGHRLTVYLRASLICTLGDTPGQIFRSMVDGYHRHRVPRRAG